MRYDRPCWIVHVCVGPAPAGRPVTGGAFRRYDDDTAELKRIWTDSGHRRRGYATALPAALEAEIVMRG
jgi:predicted GNAT family acetyltransferase